MTPGGRLATAIAAATVLNVPYGTIYAFSVFLAPLEAALGVGRGPMSAVFALATVTLTLGMNVAPRIYRAVHPGWIALGCGVAGGAGIALAATGASAASYARVLAGFGVLFGFSAGVAFTLMQHGVNSVMARPRGIVNGFLVSHYPLGAMLGAPVFGWAIGAAGLEATLAAIALMLLVTGAAAGMLLRVAAVDVRGAGASVEAAAGGHARLLWLLGTAFFLAAAAGLMVMSQAAAIIKAYGGSTALALGATTFITGAIAASRIAGGWLIDRFPVPRVAVFANLWALAGSVLLTLLPGPLIAVPALAMIGMGYGFTSGYTAAAIARWWERAQVGVVAARLYVAWCVAAVTLPVVAGWLFDRTQGYVGAVLIAAGFSVAGAVVASRLPRALR